MRKIKCRDKRKWDYDLPQRQMNTWENQHLLKDGSSAVGEEKKMLPTSYASAVCSAEKKIIRTKGKDRVKNTLLLSLMLVIIRSSSGKTWHVKRKKYLSRCFIPLPSPPIFTSLNSLKVDMLKEGKEWTKKILLPLFLSICLSVC